MGSPKKHSRKELKGPDQFQMTVGHWVGWLNKNKLTISIVIGPFLAVFIGVLAWQQVAESGRQNRVEELGKIDSQYRQESEEANKDADKVRAEIATLDEKLGKEKDPAKKKELTDRKSELEKQVAAIKPDHSGSMSRYQAYSEANITHAEGWVAGLRAGALLAERKDLDKAASVISAVLGAASVSEFYENHARLALVGILEDANKLDKALEEVSKLELKAPDSLKPIVLFSKARIQMSLGKNDEAKKTLTELTEKFDSSNQADKARAMMALLAT